MTALQCQVATLEHLKQNSNVLFEDGSSSLDDDDYDDSGSEAYEDNDEEDGYVDDGEEEGDDKVEEGVEADEDDSDAEMEGEDEDKDEDEDEDEDERMSRRKQPQKRDRVMQKKSSKNPVISSGAKNASRSSKTMIIDESVSDDNEEENENEASEDLHSECDDGNTEEGEEVFPLNYFHNFYFHYISRIHTIQEEVDELEEVYDEVEEVEEETEIPLAQTVPDSLMEEVEECENDDMDDLGRGGENGQLRYEPTCDKNHQGGDQRVPNPRTFDPESQLDARFIALFKDVVSKRPEPCKDDRLLLTPNSNWKKSGKWFKNSPVGINKLRGWFTDTAKRIGIDVKQQRKRFTNHSHRASLATLAAEAEATTEETITITGHQSTKSLTPYIN